MKVPALIGELVGYAVASAAALAIDMGLLAAFTSRLGWHYLPASALSFTAGGVVAYALSVRLAFRFHHFSNKGVEMVSFIALGTVGLLINSLVMWIAVARLGLAVIASKSCAAVCTFTVNFLLRRQMLFAAPRAPNLSAMRATE
jgi:putative flippase GtrA